MWVVSRLCKKEVLSVLFNFGRRRKLNILPEQTAQTHKCKGFTGCATHRSQVMIRKPRTQPQDSDKLLLLL